MPAYPYLSPKEAFPKAKAAARRALAIDPTLAEAHTALGFSLAVYDWNWSEAERKFKKALELNPNLSFAHFRYGWNYLAPMGRFDEAITEMKRALELEPLHLVSSSKPAGYTTSSHIFQPDAGRSVKPLLSMECMPTRLR
ncbi:MAG: tetratricopeptide repeat protein [Vicinamibacterales bacterium]